MDKSKRTVAVAFAALVWTTLILSIALGIVNAPADHLSLGNVVAGFFSSFTILSTLFAGTALVLVARDPTSLGRAGVLTAIAVYLFIVVLVYVLEFRGALESTGLRRVPDALLHLVIPLAFTLFWFAYVPKGSLTWRTPFALLVFPLAYLAYMLGRGAITGIYAYPFLDVNALGYGRVAIIASALLGIYLVVGMVYTLLDRLLSRFFTPD